MFNFQPIDLFQSNKNPLLIRLCTKLWPYHRTLHYEDKMEELFPGAFVTGVTCRWIRSIHRTPGPVSFWTCICSSCWHQSLSQTVVCLLDYALPTSLVTFLFMLRIEVINLIFRTTCWVRGGNDLKVDFFLSKIFTKRLLRQFQVGNPSGTTSRKKEIVQIFLNPTMKIIIRLWTWLFYVHCPVLYGRSI